VPVPAPQTAAAQGAPQPRHARWVRIAHWLTTISVLTLAFSGVVILMAHPRLYWGEAGNDLMPALLELPISRNYQHGGWDAATPFFGAGGPVTASRTYDIFNQNGWGRSLHFLAAWWLVLPGLVYVFTGLTRGHFARRVWPAADELSLPRMREAVAVHLRSPLRAGSQYNVLQKIAYSLVIFVAAPLMLLTGLAMSPAVTAALPLLLTVFGGYQSARTIHFFTFAALLLFVCGHLLMVIRSGFRQQMRAMTVGE
jgi:thiosulfate reductase cytochrome b subunit